MTTQEVQGLLWILVMGVTGIVSASTGMPWEQPLQTVANSLTGAGGASAATIGIVWTGINWARGTEHGKEACISTVVASSLIFGGSKLYNTIGGGAGASTLLPLAALPWDLFISDALGELLGHLLYAGWLVGGVMSPLVWRKGLWTTLKAGMSLSTRVSHNRNCNAGSRNACLLRL